MKVIANKYISFYDNLYNSFAQKCLQDGTHLDELKSGFIELKDTFIRAHKLDDFGQKTEMLSDTLTAKGKLNLANIMNTETGKMFMFFGCYDKAIPYIWTSLNISKYLSDNFHVLARLNDLEIAYKNLRQRKYLFRVLRAKKECIKSLISDYDGNLKNYQSLKRPATSLEAVKIQLAYTYTAIADMLQHRYPNDSIRAVEKARDIYAEIGHPREQNYLNERIRRMKYRLNSRSQGT